MPAAGSATLVLTRRINLALENEIASVLAVEDARFDAMTNNDVDALQLLLADDLHYVHSNGVVEGKAEFLRKITSGERRFRSFRGVARNARREGGFTRSEEHTSELQSLMRISYAVS